MNSHCPFKVTVRLSSYGCANSYCKGTLIPIVPNLGIQHTERFLKETLNREGEERATHRSAADTGPHNAGQENTRPPASRPAGEVTLRHGTWITLWHPSTVSVTPSSTWCLRRAPLAAIILRSVLVLA